MVLKTYISSDDQRFHCRMESNHNSNHNNKRQHFVCLLCPTLQVALAYWSLVQQLFRFVIALSGWYLQPILEVLAVTAPPQSSDHDSDALQPEHLWWLQHSVVTRLPFVTFPAGFSQAKSMGEWAEKIASHFGKYPQWPSCAPGHNLLPSFSLHLPKAVPLSLSIPALPLHTTLPPPT